jgi:hypothetical protein
MGLEFIIIKSLTPGEEITMDIEIHRFPCNWYRDLWFDSCAVNYRTVKISGENMFTSDQLILFGEYIIDQAVNTDDYSVDHLLKMIDDKESYDLKLKLIAKLTTCSNEYYVEHFSKYSDSSISRLGLIAKVATCTSISDILSEKEINELECDSLIYYSTESDGWDLETMRRLIHFGLDLIRYGKQGQMGFWSS